MSAIVARAPAKLNLFLRVLAREESGYHQVETLYAALDWGDDVRIERVSGAGVALEVTGLDPGPGADNLVVRAAALFREEAGIDDGLSIHLEKRIPIGGGLGGGSSDAAATLLGLNRLFGGPVPPARLVELGGALGADVPFFLAPGPLALAWGRGDRLLPLAPLPPAPVLLAFPPRAVSTAWAYESLARRREPGARPVPAGVLLPRNLASWKALGALARNDLHAVVLREFPLLREILEEMRGTTPLLSLMSGSGSALFALYSARDGAEEARGALAERFPEVDFLLTATASGVAGLEDAPER